MQTYEQFLRGRKTGVGGSDIAAVCGLSKWKSALDVYNDKISEEIDTTQTEYQYWGSTLEDIIAKEFQKRSGFAVQRINQAIRTGKDGRFIANIDRAIVRPTISGNVRVLAQANENGRLITTDTILECKTANAFSKEDWGESQLDEIIEFLNKGTEVTSQHKIPIYYEAQVQWYLAITGTDNCILVVLLGGNDYRAYFIRRNEIVGKQLMERADTFWEENVLKRVPPEAQTAEDVLKLFPEDNGTMIEATNDVASLLGDYRTAKARLDEFTKIEKELKNDLIKAIGANAGITLNGEVVATYKRSMQLRFSSTDFKKDNPDLYERYKKETPFATFRLTK